MGMKEGFAMPAVWRWRWMITLKDLTVNKLEKKIEMVGKCKSDAEIENAVLEGDLKFPHPVSLL